MADSTSDSGSVQSLQTEQVAEKKSETTTRFYALYSFYPNRVLSLDTVPSSDIHDQEDGSLSLNIIATNLAAASETDLRKNLAQKLIKNTRQTKEGNFFSVHLCSQSSEPQIPASCYYCQVETSSNSLTFDPILSDSPADGSSSNNNQQFVVCFISFLDSSLYLFRQELEEYTRSLVPLLDKELSQLSTGIHNYLEQWPVNVLGYLTRTLQYLGSSIHHLIYSALLNASLEISGATMQQEEDLRRFYKCCSLSQLLDQLQSDTISVTTGSSTDSSDLWQLQPVVVTVTFQPGQGVTFGKNYACKFCENAADTLTSLSAANVTKIREFLESIKLRFIRNLNTLKRFLKQAEIDHYALYRALSYLKKCGCGDLLLRYVKLDAGSETLNVLSVIETFVKDMKMALVG